MFLNKDDLDRFYTKRVDEKIAEGKKNIKRGMESDNSYVIKQGIETPTLYLVRLMEDILKEINSAMVSPSRADEVIEAIDWSKAQIRKLRQLETEGFEGTFNKVWNDYVPLWDKALTTIPYLSHPDEVIPYCKTNRQLQKNKKWLAQDEEDYKKALEELEILKNDPDHDFFAEQKKEVYGRFEKAKQAAIDVEVDLLSTEKLIEMAKHEADNMGFFTSRAKKDAKRQEIQKLMSKAYNLRKEAKSTASELELATKKKNALDIEISNRDSRRTAIVRDHDKTVANRKAKIAQLTAELAELEEKAKDYIKLF